MTVDIMLNQDEFNWVLVLFTCVVLSIALFLLIVMYLKFRCGCCRPRRKRPSIPDVKITMYHSTEPLNQDLTDIDFIDSRSTNVISSTTQVSSVHNSPRV